MAGGSSAGSGPRTSTGRGGADTNVVAFIFRGAIDGGRLVVESLGETPVKLRFA
jgi:hypothetical protein